MSQESTRSRATIALWHRANMGKTETLRALGNLLVERIPAEDIIFHEPRGIIPPTGDFRLVVRINERIVAIESQGDPGWGLAGRLLELVENFNADLIFCATRTSGETVAAVESFEQSHDFETVWTSTYQVQRDPRDANQLKAVHLLELATELGLL